MDIIITANSPGEVSSWVRKIVEEIHRRDDKIRITVMLPPCPFASGREKEVVMGIRGVGQVLGPSEVLKYLFFDSFPQFKLDKKGVVIFLGSDLVYAYLIGQKQGYPVVAYTHFPAFITKFFRLCLVEDEQIEERFLRRGLSKESVKVVGNLLVESIKSSLTREEACSLWGIDAQKPVVALLPGSRLYLVDGSMPLFSEAVKKIKEALPDVQFTLSLSPFINAGYLEKWLKIEDFKENTAESQLKDSKVAIKLIKSMNYDVMFHNDLAITVPGTNTAELGYLGKAMICVVPTADDVKRRMPLTGVFGLFNYLPFIGPIVNKMVAEWYEVRIKYLAWPNVKGQREVTPEIRLLEEEGQLSSLAVELLADPVRREEISRNLQKIMGSDRKDAPKLIVDYIMEVGKEIGNG